MNKRRLTILLVLSIVIIVIVGMIIYALSQYIATYEPWYSFLSLDSAIAVLVVTCVIGSIGIAALVFSIVKLSKLKAKDDI